MKLPVGTACSLALLCSVACGSGGSTVIGGGGAKTIATCDGNCAGTEGCIDPQAQCEFSGQEEGVCVTTCSSTTDCPNGQNCVNGECDCASASTASLCELCFVGSAGTNCAPFYSCSGTSVTAGVCQIYCGGFFADKCPSGSTCASNGYCTCGSLEAGGGMGGGSGGGSAGGSSGGSGGGSAGGSGGGNPDCPTVTSVSPTSGAAGTNVTITGTHLAAAVVAIDGIETTVPVTTTDTQLVVYIRGLVTGPLTVASAGCPTLTPVASFVIPYTPGATSYEVNLTQTYVSGETCIQFAPSLSEFGLISASGDGSFSLITTWDSMVQIQVAGTIDADGTFAANGDTGTFTQNASGFLGPDGTGTTWSLTQTLDANTGYANQCSSGDNSPGMFALTSTATDAPAEVDWQARLSLSYSGLCPLSPGVTNHIVTLEKTEPGDSMNLRFYAPDPPNFGGTVLNGPLQPGGTGAASLVTEFGSAYIALEVQFNGDGSAQGNWSQSFYTGTSNTGEPTCIEVATAKLTPLAPVQLALP